MANITIKRNTGGSYEALYPRTIVTQLFDTDGSTALFDGSKKLKATYLPSFVFGGMKMAGVVDLSTGSTEGNAISLSTLFGSIVNYSNYTTTAEQSIGTYFIVNAAGFVTSSLGTLGSVAYYAFKAFVATTSPYYSADLGEEGDNTPPIYLERGDWIVLNGKTSPTSGVYYYTFSVVNNTYADASSSVKGVVYLSQSTSTQDSSTDVITEYVLNGLIGTGAGQIAAGDHTHTGYQAADGDLTALSALSGTGFVKRTGADTYTLDTSTYLTSQSTDFKTVAVTDTDSGFTWADTGSAVAEATGDTLTVVSGNDIEVDVDSASDAIRISHADTSSLSGAYGSAGISSITVDGEGHVTAISTSTYNNYSLPLAAAGTRGGVQLGATETELNRAVVLDGDEDAYVALPRQIPAVTLNGASSTAPSFYAPTGSGLTGSTTQVKQSLVANTSAAPSWIDTPVIYYDTTTGSTLGDIILDVE